MSLAKFVFNKTAVFAAAAAFCGATCHAQDTRTQTVLNIPVINGKTTVIAVSAKVDASGRRVSGSAGGADIMDGNVHIANASTGNVTNAVRHDGDMTVFATGQSTLRSISVAGGARTGDITNAVQRKGNLVAVAGGIEGSTSGLSASAGTAGGATIDSVRVCGGRTGNVTNAGQVKGDATYVGGNVSVNSVSIGCM